MAIDFKSELNEEQYAAVSSSARSLLILAGAGTGKTRTLTYRVAWLLSQGVAPENILLLTFTNKAAREMLTRVEILTHYTRDHFWGGTFHHIAQRLIRPNATLLGLQTNFGILDESDALQLFTESIRQVSPEFLKNKNVPKPKVLLESIDYARNAHRHLEEALAIRWTEDDLALSDLLAFFKKYQSQKQEQSVLDYNDLLEWAVRLLKEHPDIAHYYNQRFRHILIDEYQDTNDLQGQLIHFLAADHQIFAVGDDAQCIYNWRGANIENIHRFAEKHPQASICKITLNYRSTPEILRLANAIPVTNKQIFRKELHATRASHKKPFWVHVTDFRQQAKFIVKRLQGLIDEGYHLSDVAVLYRAHYQSMELQMELTKAQIAYTVTSGVRFFEQVHIRDLIAMLRAIYNRHDRCAWMRILSRLPKVGEKTADRILGKIEEDVAKSGRDFWEILEDNFSLELCPQEARIHWITLVRSLLKAHRHLPKNSSQEEPASAIDLFAYATAQQKNSSIVKTEDASPQMLLSILWEDEYRDYVRRNFSNHSSRSDDVTALLNFSERFENVGDFLLQVSLLQSEETETDEDKETLSLTTIHQAKGLEFPVVFIISLSDGLFPLKRALEEEASIQEERRLFYVAVTRAKDELYLCCPRWAAPRNAGGYLPSQKPSRFLEELSHDTYETLYFQFPPSSLRVLGRK
ncbi:MAG: UvrD-helicase domain-containing protein [Puniceicoccales bacterium]|jgi:DNA helicase-2/ATP-dependent DNA helicase PcrA|nr:UvrD-helicase domain-containing protein [Puniceicoccales bacterium]